jgi:CheY-like chemotaxis protein
MLLRIRTPVYLRHGSWGLALPPRTACDCGVLLLVEDNDCLREALGVLFETEGHEVARATNGRDALAQLRAGLRPSLIVLDLMMPVMNGVEFLRHQRADPALAHIPVIIHSSADDMLEQIQGLSVLACLRKPASLSRLVELVATHARLH